MILPIKPICKKERIRSDGTNVIYLQCCFNLNQKVLVDSGIAIPSEYWNKKNSRISPSLPESFGRIKDREQQLLKKILRAEDLTNYAFTNGIANPIQFLKQKFSTDFDPKKQAVKLAPTAAMNVFWCIDDYIKSKEGGVKRCTINVITSMKEHLLCFQAYRKNKITFDSFDEDFHEEFLNFLIYEIPHLKRKELIKGLKLNSVGKTIKHLKYFLKTRMKKRIIPFIDLSDYKIPEANVDAIYLSWKEISTIYHLDLTRELHLEKYRDLFVLGCLTGFRFNDYPDVKPDEVRDGMLSVTQAKTCTRLVMPLRPYLKKILDKYHHQIPQVSNPDFNFHIKEVAKLAGLNELIKITHKGENRVGEKVRPKIDWVISHTCRRYFCINEFLDGTPVNLIMATSGHRTEKAFRKYINVDNLQNYHMIRKLWESRPAL